MGMEVVPILAELMASATLGKSLPSADAEGHGEDDPEGEEAVEEGEALGDACGRAAASATVMADGLSLPAESLVQELLHPRPDGVPHGPKDREALLLRASLPRDGSGKLQCSLLAAFGKNGTSSRWRRRRP